MYERDKKNSRCDSTLCPGEAVQKTFGINLVKMHETKLSELRKRIAL